MAAAGAFDPAAGAEKLPAWVRCLLWGLAAVRLVLPIRFESAWSLVPSAETLSQNTVRYDAVPQLTSGIEALNSAVNERLMEPYFRADAAVSMNPLHVWTEIAGIVWLIGCAALLLYALVRLVQTKRCVREAALLGDNVWLCDAVASPFILGVLRPRVYLPSGLDGAARDYVLAHERAHLARRDHWWKPLGYLLLAVYWFQPLCWFAYRCFCRDLELACDERAVRELGLAERKAYSSALLSCATAGRAVLACPLAFGEVGVKERVKRVLNYKKPAFWVTLIAILLCIVLAVCFLTNPKTAQEAATTGDLPPMLTFGEARYVAPEKPVTHLPYGYIRAGLVTKEQFGRHQSAGPRLLHPRGRRPGRAGGSLRLAGVRHGGRGRSGGFHAAAVGLRPLDSDGRGQRRPLYCQAADAGRCGVPRGEGGFAHLGRFRELRFSGGRLWPLYPAVPDR